MIWNVRPFSMSDYEGLAELDAAVDADNASGVEEFRHTDETWDHDRYFKQRLLAVAEDGKVIGWGTVSHVAEQYHPDKYALSLGVDPRFRRRGAGSALYDASLATLRDRGAVAVRTEAKESIAAGIRFAEQCGFLEMQREWESMLDVAGFSEAPFAAAPEKAAAAGIRFSTLAAERKRDPEVLLAIYELYLVCNRDVPDIDPITDVTFDYFLSQEVDGPGPLLDGFFLAKDGERFVGLSNLYKGERDSAVIHQGLTGVIPEYRGRGVATALKLLTVDYAKRHGKREIRTWNNTLNKPMLRINEAMGFQKEPVWIIFQKALIPGVPGEEMSAGIEEG